MAKCEICSKGIITGHRLSITRSHISRRANRTWKPNIRNVRVVGASGEVKSVKICAKCLRAGKVQRAI